MDRSEGEGARRNITVSLDRDLIRRLKILAARRSMSISALVSGEIVRLVEEDDAYEQAKSKALSLLDEPFRSGNARVVDRSNLHDRKDLR